MRLVTALMLGGRVTARARVIAPVSRLLSDCGWPFALADVALFDSYEKGCRWSEAQP